MPSHSKFPGPGSRFCELAKHRSAPHKAQNLPQGRCLCLLCALRDSVTGFHLLAGTRDPASLAYARSGFRVPCSQSEEPGILPGLHIGCALRDSNPRPSPCKGVALPTELSAPLPKLSHECSRRESNPHQGLRRALFYPLNYESLIVYLLA